MRVTDDGETVAAYFGNSTNPVVSAKIPGRGAHSHLAIYNRESVGAVTKESVLDHFKLPGGSDHSGTLRVFSNTAILVGRRPNFASLRRSLLPNVLNRLRTPCLAR
jgi:hypothetical protein